ncbi:MAG: hypothetical protein ACP5N0_01630 [Methanosarcina sp.]
MSEAEGTAYRCDYIATPRKPRISCASEVQLEKSRLGRDSIQSA